MSRPVVSSGSNIQRQDCSHQGTSRVMSACNSATRSQHGEALGKRRKLPFSHRFSSPESLLSEYRKVGAHHVHVVAWPPGDVQPVGQSVQPAAAE